MKPLLSAALIAAVLISGCSSLTDSVRGPHASSHSTATDAGVDAGNGAAFPQDTDQGKF